MEEQKLSKKMDEFLDKVDTLCFEYQYEIHPTVKGWTGKGWTKNPDTFAVIGKDEVFKLLFIDGDGRGK